MRIAAGLRAQAETEVAKALLGKQVRMAIGESRDVTEVFRGMGDLDFDLIKATATRVADHPTEGPAVDVKVEFRLLTDIHTIDVRLEVE